MLDRLEAARRELADLRELATGRLRVGAFATADASLVPKAIAAFRAAHPAVTVTLTGPTPRGWPGSCGPASWTWPCCPATC
ncbi:LysR substrate-binding domain-containing protein [Kutzneria sp. 744]|uniref:LysR substrate-binding domain-containing protein n=1 Tax=Kutzneria sp. (strain 744) TaxID=345341 RepID=UPI0004B95DC0